MAKLIQRYRDHHDYIWKCDCYGHHFLELSWDDEDPEWRYLSISESFRDMGWKKRFKIAWQALRGKPAHGPEVLLDEANVSDLLEVLVKHSGFEFPRHRALEEIKEEGSSEPTP